MVAAVAEDGFIGGTKDGCIVFLTDVALDLHGLKLKDFSVRINEVLRRRRIKEAWGLVL